MRVLAMGQGAKQFVEGLFEGVPDLVIDTTDLKPGSKQSGYDSLIAYNILNRISYRDVNKYLKLWLEAVRPGGEMLIMFPSLEWAAEQVLHAPKPSPALQVHLFGIQRSPHETNHGAYTLMQMRDMLQEVGLKVTHVTTGIYTILDHEADMHSIRGVK